MNSPHEFAAILAGLREALNGATPGRAALATLLSTRGPVFRRAGARMLVFADGRTVRGLSAGCPEADIVTRARRVIETGVAEIARYDHEQGLDVLLEMGCGGELEVLIEPVGNADLQAFEVVSGCLKQRHSGVLATVYARDGRCLRSRRWIDAGPVSFDGLDDPELSAAVRAAANPGDGSCRTVTLDVNGLRYDVLFEALQPPLALTLIGINATSIALTRLAQQLGWPSTLIAPRDPPLPASDNAELAANVRRLCAAPDAVAALISTDARSAVVVMTHNLGLDQAYLAALRDVPLMYLGAIGARQRVERLRGELSLPDTDLRAPAGLDIGSETPEEIALAIAAEIQAVAAGRRGEPLSASDRPIH